MGRGERTRWQVIEVHNFGGFFGGDTVTLTAARCDDWTEETLTIDEKALTNVCERHAVAPSMVLDLEMTGERVDAATLVAAGTWEIIDAAVGEEPAPGTFDKPRVRAYVCPHCQLWIVGTPIGQCNMCGTPFPAIQ